MYLYLIERCINFWSYFGISINFEKNYYRCFLWEAEVFYFICILFNLMNSTSNDNLHDWISIRSIKSHWNYKITVENVLMLFKKENQFIPVWKAHFTFYCQTFIWVFVVFTSAFCAFVFLQKLQIYSYKVILMNKSTYCVYKDF